MPWREPYGPLRTGETDVLLTLLPIDEPDLKVGGVLVSHGRVLALRPDHPLARRETVDIEDLADCVLLDAPDRRYLAYHLGGPIVAATIVGGEVVWRR